MNKCSNGDSNIQYSLLFGTTLGHLGFDLHEVVILSTYWIFSFYALSKKKKS